MAPAVTTVLAFLLLTSTSIMAVIRSRGDTAAASFAAASYLILVMLFYFLRQFEAAAPGGSVLRARVGIWATTTLLTAMFSWRVAAVMPWPVAAGVWLMGGSTVAGGSYTLFLLPSRAH